MNSFKNPNEGCLSYVAISEHARVADADQAAILQEATAACIEALESGKPQIATALHIGGLNAMETLGFAGALRRARLVYADGIAVVLLARLAGAARVRRAATTDIGIPVIEAVAEALNRPVRIALVGGKPKLAEAAGTSLEQLAPSEIVFTTDGYKNHQEWQVALKEIRSAQPDVVLLGLGSPQELIFADHNLLDLPPALILTCGGWFGFLAGEERRAPTFLRALGLEWVGRLTQDPKRLALRYGRGAFVFAFMSLKIATRRMGIVR